MSRVIGSMLAVLTLTLIAVGSAQAQATRTWVSGVGDDVNPCSRTAPCKTFAGAISKTAAGGEISVLDPGGYGAVVITKAMTLSGGESYASVLASGTNGISVQAGVNDMVVIRNISIKGTGGLGSGVRYVSGAALVIEDSDITGGFQNGIEVATSGDSSLTVSNTSITGNTAGVRVNSNAARLDVVLSNVNIRRATRGIDASGGQTMITNSTISQNTGIGVYAQAGAVSLENSMIASNGIGIQALSGSTVRVVNSGVYNNVTGFMCDPGNPIASSTNNRKGGNGNGSTATCTPFGPLSTW